jgi:hypothetical protein
MATAIAILETNPNVGLVYSGAEFFGEKTGKCELPPYRFPEVLLGNMIFNSGFYRKADWETIGGYRPNMIYGWEDYDFWLSIIELGRDVVYLPEPLYFYRQVPHSRSERLTKDYLVKSYEQIFHNHPQLYSDHIGTVFQHLVDLRENVQQTHARLHETEVCLHETSGRLHSQLEQRRVALEQLQRELERSQSLIAAMKSSKFWQLRTQWFKLKRKLGLKIDGESDLLL